jgi:cytochrome c
MMALAASSASAADVAHGKVVYEKCAACHLLTPGATEVGPSLAGIMGRKAASQDDFRYSTAMRRSNIVWDEKTIDAYLADPQGYIKGNRMPFAGLPDQKDREDVIAYLKEAAK